MDGYQSILDMQVLTIEKTLGAMDQFLQTDYNREITEIVTQIGMIIHSLTMEMRKTASRILMSKSSDRRLKPFSRPNFSHAIMSKSRSKMAMDKRIEDYACSKLFDSFQKITLKKKKQTFDDWKYNSLNPAKTRISNKVRFGEEIESARRSLSFVSAEPSRKAKSTVESLIARHNDLADRDREEEKRPYSHGDRVGTSLSSYYDEDRCDSDIPYEYDANDSNIDMGNAEEDESEYSPALFSASDGAPLQIDSLTDFYSNQMSSSDVTDKKDMVSGYTHKKESYSSSPYLAEDGNKSFTINNNTNNDSPTSRGSSSKSPARSNRYILPFSIDSVDELYNQVMENDQNRRYGQGSDDEVPTLQLTSWSLLSSMVYPNENNLPDDRELSHYAKALSSSKFTSPGDGTEEEVDGMAEGFEMSP